MVMMQMIAWGLWLTRAIFYGEFGINLVLDARLLRILHKQKIKKQLPWFVSYIAWELLQTAIGLVIWVFRPRLYTTVFWWMEGPRVVLLLGAVRESLLRIFKGFESLLRGLVMVVILGVVVYSAWKAVDAPPVQSDRLVSFVLAAEFAFRWCIAGISVLSMGLMWFVQEPVGSQEDAVITGAGIASIAFVAWVITRSLFGTRFISFTQYLPDMGYFIAAFYWIKVFQRPVAEFGFKQLGMGPEGIRRELRRYRELAEQIMRKLS